VCLSPIPHQRSDVVFAQRQATGGLGLERIGGENSDGSPRRITNMTYLREIPMLTKHIQEHGGNILAGAREMLWTKLMFEPFKEIWENRDFFGTASGTRTRLGTSRSGRPSRTASAI